MEERIKDALYDFYWLYIKGQLDGPQAIKDAENVTTKKILQIVEEYK